VKDINNILDYNVWSATDYSNDITGFNKGAGINLHSTNTNSTVGEHSLKLTNKGSGAYRLRIYFTASKNDTVTISFDFLNQSSNFVALYNGSTQLVSIYPSEVTNWHNVALSAKIISDDDVFLQINCNADQDCLVDNFNCIIN